MMSREKAELIKGARMSQMDAILHLTTFLWTFLEKAKVTTVLNSQILPYLFFFNSSLKIYCQNAIFSRSFESGGGSGIDESGDGTGLTEKQTPQLEESFQTKTF